MKRHPIARALLPALLWMALGSHVAHTQSLMCQARVSSIVGGPVPLTVFFAALGAGGQPPLAYHWDFGDGASSSLPDPFHIYTEAGIYSAVLTVTPSGMAGSACRDTVVIPVAFFIDPLCWAMADVTWSESSAPIVFNAGPALLGDPSPYEWTWSFGDGSSSTVETQDFFLPVSVPHGYAVPGTYWATVWLRTSFGLYACFPTLRISTLVPQTPVAIAPPAAVTGLRIEPARPNPFAKRTELGFALPRSGAIRLMILDLQGRRVATLADGVRSAGEHDVVWQGRTDAGRTVAAGVYLALLEQEGNRALTRITRLP